MERIRFVARIYARDGAEYTGGGYPTLRQAIRGAQAECKIMGGAKYYIHKVVSVHGLCRNRCQIGRSEKPPDAPCHAGARRNPVGARNRNRRGAEMTTADQPEITKNKRC